jgi:hypothetical protein
VIEMVGQLTVMLAVDELFVFAEAASFVAATEAVFEIEGHLAEPAVPETWIVWVAALFMFPKAHERTPAAIEQSPLSCDHVIPVGSVSESVTPLA